AFEVENDEIFTRVEDLTKVIIAVNADLRGVRLSVKQALFPFMNLLFREKDLFCLLAKCFRQLRQFLFQQGEVASQQRAHVLISGTLRHGVKWLRRKGVIAIGRSEGTMQFRRALPEKRRFLGINPADESIEKDSGRRDLILQIRLAPENALVIATDRVQSQSPSVRFAYYRTLQYANNRWFGFCPTIFDGAAEGGHIRKIGPFRQEACDFHIGIYAILELAIKL